MRTIWTLAKKDLRLLARDPVDLFFVTAFPLVFGVLFGLIYSGGGGSTGEIDVVVVDRDRSKASMRLIEEIDASDAVAVTAIDDSDEGRRLVRLGEAVAFLEIAEGFEESVRGVFSGAQTPPMTGAIDPSRVAEAGVLQGVITAAGFSVFAETLADAEVMDDALARAKASLAEAEGVDVITRGLFGTLIDTGRRLAQKQAADEAAAAESGEEDGAGGLGGFVPVRMELESIAREDGTRPRSAFEITFPQAAAWAVLGCVAGFGMSLVRERSSGTLLRLAVAPMSRRSIVLGKSLACFLATVSVLVALEVAGALVFGVRVHAWWSAAMAIFSTAFGFVGLMMFLASISQTEGGAEGFVRAMLLVLAIVGGAGMPLFFMPSWMQVASGISPFRWAISALEGASFRGYSFAEMLVPCGVLLGIGLSGFGAAFFLFRKWSVD